MEKINILINKRINYKKLICLSPGSILLHEYVSAKTHNNVGLVCCCKKIT